jgi:D-beta-D-heptose 7-phosphate kinase/D-beta-D-heptose 1-phosphate adenosyltransferase
MPTHKMKTVDEVAAVVRDLRSAGMRVVLANGCFDLLHPGHIDLLRKARDHKDALIVAINSDDSVRRLKGENRPIYGQNERAEILAALEPVDLVCVFDEDTPLNAILKIHPDVLVKGADWKGRGIVGQREVEGWGGAVAALELVDGQSTTGIVERILDSSGAAT